MATNSSGGCAPIEKYSAVPIIIVSTESESKDKMKGFEAGANLYIAKPCSPEMMVENVRLDSTCPGLTERAKRMPFSDRYTGTAGKF